MNTLNKSVSSAEHSTVQTHGHDYLISTYDQVSFVHLNAVIVSF